MLTAAAVLGIAGVVLAVIALRGSPDSGSDSGARQGEPATGRLGRVDLLVAGDIAQCDSNGDEATARLAAKFPKVPIAAVGDIAYPRGTTNDFARCYQPSWGKLDNRVHPAPGNHEYGTGRADGYFARYGQRAGAPGRGWYSYELRGWHVVVLNSNCGLVPGGGCAAGSQQERWLRADLAAHPARCTLAYWHHPRRSSGLHGDNPPVEPLRRALADAGADIVVAGHDHHYERFAPERGLREWVVGTGGAGNYPIPRVERGSQVRWTGGHGLLALSLRPGGYRWRFMTVGGKAFADSGAGTCH